jgi:hypothetical protein
LFLTPFNDSILHVWRQKEKKIPQIQANNLKLCVAPSTN